MNHYTTNTNEQAMSYQQAATGAMPPAPPPKNKKVRIVLIVAIALLIAALAVSGVLIYLHFAQEGSGERMSASNNFAFSAYEAKVDDIEKVYYTAQGTVPKEKEKEAIDKAYDFVRKDNEENHFFERVEVFYNPCRLECTLDSGYTYYHYVSEPSCLKDESGEVVETESVAENTPAQAQIDYAVLEKLLDDYAYGYVGGFMDFGYYNQKLYFADTEYNTSEVLYFDPADNEIHTLATDDNPFSAPCEVSNTSVIVNSFSTPQDPLDLDWSLAKPHVYDFESGELKVLENNFPSRFLLSYEGGKVYGATDNAVWSADADGGNTHTEPFYSEDYAREIYHYGGSTFVEYTEDEREKTCVAKLNSNSVDVLIRADSSVFFADNHCYYALEENDSYAFYDYDLETETEQKVGSVDKVSKIYFVMGDRIYYNYRVDESGKIAICYYDMTTSGGSEVSSDMPQLGGW